MYLIVFNQLSNVIQHFLISTRLIQHFIWQTEMSHHLNFIWQVYVKEEQKKSTMLSIIKHENEKTNWPFVSEGELYSVSCTN